MLNETHLRAFFALEINDELQKIATHIINAVQIQPDGHKVKWMPSHKLHLTLRFLGEVDSQHIHQCITTLMTTLKTIPPFTIQADKVFNFPATKPRIIALHFPLGKELANLYRIVESTCRATGFQAEKHGFLPHITLGRMSSPVNFDYLKLASADFPPFLIKDIALFRSDFCSDGSVYKVLQRLQLGC